MTTLTDKDGNEYEQGKVYEFRDVTGLRRWCIGVLAEVNANNDFQFIDDVGNNWKYIKISNCILGAITPPLIKLVDGKPYAFVSNSIDFMGVYDEDNGLFSVGGLGDVFQESCSSIRPITIQGE